MRFWFGDYSLDTDRRELRRGPELVSIGPQVFDTIAFLIENRGRVVSKDDLLAAVWQGRIVSESTLTSHMNAVRKAVGDSGEAQSLIRTVARKGFLFVGEIKESRAQTDQRDVALTRESDPDRAHALADKPSIAVLPFVNLGGDPEQEYFADGMAEEIITALSRFAWLFVIARNSSFTYKGKNVDVRQVGRELGVRYVLEGGVRKGGDRIRFTTQLIEATTGSHIWADRFEGDLHDVFALQDRITGNVVAAIEPKLQLAEIARLKQKPAANLDAYDLYLRALQLENEFTEASLTEALNCLRRAFDHDPNFAPALALVGYCSVLRSLQGWVKDFRAEATDALRLANRAIELEPDDANILSMVALAIFLFTGDSPRGLDFITRALSINPNAPMILTTAAWVNVIDNPDAAVAYAERARRLNPRDPRAWLNYMVAALGHMWAGRYREAIIWADKALLLRRLATPLRILVMSHIRLGERDKAVVALQEQLKIDPTLTLSTLHLRLQAVRTREWAWKLMYESMKEAGLPE